MIKVSVIAPMYCAKAVMEPCVNALLRQGLEEMEILLVDDCSPDDTYEYACELWRNHPKVRVLRMEENGGPGLARNKGIDEAQGEYVCFCDIDDCYRDGAIKTMYEEAVRFHADVYVATEGYMTVVETLPDDLSTIPEENLLRVGFVPEEEALDEETPDFAGDMESRMNGWLEHHYHWTSIGKLYRRAYLNEHQVRFHRMRIAEDQLFILDNLIHAEVYVSQNKCPYIVRTGIVNSVTRGKKTPRVFISALRSIFETIECMDDVFRDEPFFEAHPEYRQKLLDYQIQTIEKEFCIPKYREFGRALLDEDEEVREVFEHYFGNQGAFIKKTVFDSYDAKPGADASKYDGADLYEKLKRYRETSPYLRGGA